MSNEIAGDQDVTLELRRYLETQSKPVAVRSSSLFEDAFMQPFAGIYSSELLPNHPDLPLEERLNQLEWAVKRVYASTFSQEAQRKADRERRKKLRRRGGKPEFMEL